MTTETPVLTRKVFDPVETHFTPGERSMVAWITTDSGPEPLVWQR